jgi:hypothetical protein
LGTAATIGLLYQPQMIGDGDCGEIGGMKIGRCSQSTSVYPANHSTNFSIIITRGWHNRSLVAAVLSGLNWTPPPTIPIKKKLI